MDALIRRRMMMAGSEPLPPATPVYYDRIQFDGTAYIETDLYLPTDGSISAGGFGYEGQHILQNVIRLGDSDGALRTGIYISSSGSRGVAWRYSSDTNLREYGFSWLTVQVLNYWLTPYKAGAGNNVGNITPGNLPPVRPLSIGGTSPELTNISNFTGCGGIIMIFDDTAKNAATRSELLEFTPLYTLTPCTYRGQAGYWCEETSRFYGNSAGAGQLTAINLNP